jgi:hypothetical protein
MKVGLVVMDENPADARSAHYEVLDRRDQPG